MGTQKINLKELDKNITKFLAETSKEDFKKLVDEIEAKGIKGPLPSEFFGRFLKIIEEIPKPVAKRKLTHDKREKFLNEWKELFESIHPLIVVTIKDFPSGLPESLEHKVEFASDYQKVKIFVELPEEFKIRYLIGLPYDRMFSHVEVMGDDAYFAQEDDVFDCEPRTKPWKFFYNELCKITEKNKKEIPNPKKSDSD